MKDKIKLWELIKWASEGAYVDGDKFLEVDSNEKLIVKGNKLVGFKEIKLNTEWIYKDNEL